MAEHLHSSKQERFRLLQRPVMIACSVVEAIRRARRAGTIEGTGGEVVLGLLFAAARVARLRGTSKETFVHVAGTFWELGGEAPR